MEINCLEDFEKYVFKSIGNPVGSNAGRQWIAKIQNGAIYYRYLGQTQWNFWFNSLPSPATLKNISLNHIQGFREDYIPGPSLSPVHRKIKQLEQRFKERKTSATI